MAFQYPRELEDHINLPDGEMLRIRPLHRGEDRPIRQLYESLSPDTRYLRFFSPMPLLPDPVLQVMSCVDYWRRVALLAELDTPGGRKVVGLGNFAATDHNTAEVGLVVADQWQRRGIGTALAWKVLLAAEARGFNRFVAHILHGNTAIRKLLNRNARIVSMKTESAVSEVAFVRRGCEAAWRML